MVGLNFNTGKRLSPILSLSKEDTAKINTENSLSILAEIRNEQLEDIKELIAKIRELGWIKLTGCFAIIAGFLSITASMSDAHGYKSLFRLACYGGLLTLWILLVLTAFVSFAVFVRWGYMWLRHRSYIRETSYVLDTGFFNARYKEDPPKYLWSLSIIFTVMFSFLLHFLITSAPFLGEFVIWVTE